MTTTNTSFNKTFIIINNTILIKNILGNNKSKYDLTITKLYQPSRTTASNGHVADS